MSEAKQWDSGNPFFGWVKLVVLFVIAALVLMLVGCQQVRAADELPEEEGVAPANEAAPLEGGAMVPVARAKRNPNNLDIIFGFQGMLQEDINVPTATEKWKIRAGGSSWLGYRRDIGDGLFSFGAKLGFRSFGLMQENSTTGFEFDHSIQSFFLMPNVRLSVPLGTPRALWFIDVGVGVGIHEFVLDDDVPDGTPDPTVDSSGAVDLMSGFLFCVYEGDARVDLGFNVDVLGAEADVKKIYPSGSPAANKFKNFDLGHVGLDFNLTVKF